MPPLSLPGLRDVSRPKWGDHPTSAMKATPTGEARMDASERQPQRGRQGGRAPPIYPYLTVARPSLVSLNLGVIHDDDRTTSPWSSQSLNNHNNTCILCSLNDQGIASITTFQGKEALRFTYALRSIHYYHFTYTSLLHGYQRLCIHKLSAKF